MPLSLRHVVRQRGVTLTELMIALVLGALVVLAATAMVVTSRGTYRTQDESTRLAESARFGLELSNRLVRLAGYTNFGNPNARDLNTPPANYVADITWPGTADAYSLDGPNIVGANNSKPSGAAGLNGSDSLTIRYFGSNDINTGVADGNVLDCAGFAVPEPRFTSAANLDQANRRARAYNVLFVDSDTDGEPALKCQRFTFDPTTGAVLGRDTQTLIRGVEDFQVLYGEVIAQPAPNDDLDLYPPASIIYRTGIGGTNHVLDWNNVRTVRIAMLLRSATGARSDVEPASNSYKLFGANYAAAASTDAGNTFNLTSLSSSDRTRVRRVVETTIFIRNRMGEWPSLKVN